MNPEKRFLFLFTTKRDPIISMKIVNFIIVENIHFRDRENKMAAKRVTSLCVHSKKTRKLSIRILGLKTDALLL